MTGKVRYRRKARAQSKRRSFGEGRSGCFSLALRSASCVYELADRQARAHSKCRSYQMRGFAIQRSQTNECDIDQTIGLRCWRSGMGL